MKSIWLGCAFLTVAGVVLAGCGANDPAGTEGQSEEGVSSLAASSLHEHSVGPSTAAAANTIMKVTPPAPTLSTAAGLCPVGEHSCEMANDKGICVERCVPAGVMCVAPQCVVCDPAGPRPNPACNWDSEQCQWDCPICDPVGGQPRAGCTWDTKSCQWDCPVCDPPPPPEKGCTWDPNACVWLCL